MHLVSRMPIGIYEKAFPDDLSWEERLGQAAEAGYDFVEISIDESDARLARLDWSISKRDALCQAMRESGVKILTMGLSGHRKFPLGSASQDTRERALEILYRAIELASGIGVRAIQIMGYDVFYEPSDADTEARFIEGLRMGVRWASSAGVMLALENVDVEFVNSVEKAMRFVREVDSPWFQVYPDIGNLVAAEYDPISQLRLAKGHIVGIHIKDAIPGKVRGVPFERGIVPFPDVFRTLAEIGFWGPLVVEMWAHLDTTGDPLGAAVRARELVDRLVKMAYSEDRN